MTNIFNTSKITNASSTTIEANAMNKIKELQNQYDETIESTSSQQKYDSNIELAQNNKLNEYYDYQHKFGFLSNFKENNKLVETKLHSVESHLKELIDVSQKASTLIANANSSTGEGIDIAANADSLLARVESALNFKDSNGYIFGGTKTNEHPVIDLESNSNLNDENIPTDSYFNGNKITPENRIDENRSIRVGVTAGEDYFVDLIGGLNLLKQGKIEDSQEYIKSAEKGMVGARSSIGNSLQNIEQQNKKFEDNTLFLQEQFHDTFQADTPEKMTEASQIRAQLEASMKIFAMVQRTNLADFI